MHDPPDFLPERDPTPPEEWWFGIDECHLQPLQPVQDASGLLQVDSEPPAQPEAILSDRRTPSAVHPKAAQIAYCVMCDSAPCRCLPEEIIRPRS